MGVNTRRRRRRRGGWAGGNTLGRWRRRRELAYSVLCAVYAVAVAMGLRSIFKPAAVHVGGPH